MSLFYLQLPNDDRLDMRMPALLKEHADRCAKALGESLSEYIIQAVAQRVTDELPSTGSWQLSADEQAHLLKVLSLPAPVPERLRTAQQRANELFTGDVG